MGRAIVRKPSLFLMDEPLSNLDAKLRVQMRAEIAGIQQDLGVTTLYVTHDQVEAMTMGDRVAVIKDGVLQQVADPEMLYAKPANVFVAAFIGSPSMNLVEGLVSRGGDGFEVSIGSQKLAVPTEVVGSHAGLMDHLDRPLIVGFRPENLDDAAVYGDHPAHHRLRATVDVREALGAETLIHFKLDAPAVDSGDPDALDQLGDSSTSRITARFTPRTQARVGDEIEVTVDVSSLHFFDKSTHLALDG